VSAPASHLVQDEPFLSATRDELEIFTKPLCSESQYERKIRNFEAVERSFIAREEYCATLPIHLHVEVTANCNFHCPICPRGRGFIERTGHLPYEAFARLLGYISEGLVSLTVSGWGEPLLNPETPKMISAATRNTVPVFMNTNGTVLDRTTIDEILDSGLRVICISLDGAVSRATHLYDEEFSFTDVVKNVEALAAAKQKGGYAYPLIHGKFIVTYDTVDEVERLTSWASALGVEHVKFKRKIRTMPGQVPRTQFTPVAELLKITERPRIRSNELLTFEAIGCCHPWDSLYLDGNGNVGLCSWDPHQLISLGAATKDFDALWNGELMKKVRRWHSGKESTVGDPCLTCNRLPGYLMQG
jgi:MoaA/NifB/PqqE/SkfB family radical SAM enzyme